MREIDPDILFFFERKPAELDLFLIFRDRVLAMFPDTVIEVRKTQISFRRKYIFACVSMQRMKGSKPPFVTITFGLGDRIDHLRIAAASEPRPGRWTHHVTVSRAEDIDDVLMGWIKSAGEFSMEKR